jgi:hypothetical protein
MKRDELDAILAAAEQGPWKVVGYHVAAESDRALTSETEPWDAESIAVTHNLTPKMLAVVDAARRADDLWGKEGMGAAAEAVAAALADFDAALEGES